MNPAAALIAAVAFAAFAAGPAHAQSAEYPATAVMGALRTGCADKATVNAAAKGGKLPGWTRVADSASTPVGAMVKMGADAAQGFVARGAKLTPTAVFSATVAGESLYLVVSGVTTGDATVLACRVYDPGETRVITAATAQPLVGRAPDKAIERKELTHLSWQGGLTPGQDAFDIYVVPADSPAVAMLQISGVAMKVDWLEETAASKKASKRARSK